VSVSGILRSVAGHADSFDSCSAGGGSMDAAASVAPFTNSGRPRAKAVASSSNSRSSSQVMVIVGSGCICPRPYVVSRNFCRPITDSANITSIQYNPAIGKEQPRTRNTAARTDCASPTNRTWRAKLRKITLPVCSCTIRTNSSPVPGPLVSTTKAQSIGRTTGNGGVAVDLIDVISPKTSIRW
jgi:hypothetical protein